MSKVIEVYVRRNYHWGTNPVRMFGSKYQLQSDRHFDSFCPSTWVRKTGIKLNIGETKHIRITFEEIDDE